jgi:hypothetical protein
MLNLLDLGAGCRKMNRNCGDKAIHLIGVINEIKEGGTYSAPPSLVGSSHSS